MKKKYFLDKFLLEWWIMMFSFTIILFLIYFILKLFNKDEDHYYQIGLFGLFFLIVTMKSAFQWVEINSKGVYAKSLFGLIKFSSWEVINKIEISTTLQGRLTPRYFIIFTNENIIEGYRLTYNRKSLNIRVPYCEETKSLIRKYYNGEIIDLPYKTIVQRRKYFR